jgi:hypothetical protein
MKNALLFVLMTLCAALPAEAVNAATGTDTKVQPTERSSSQSADHGQPMKKNKPHGFALAPKPNHSQPLPKNQKRSTPQKLTGTQQASPRSSGMPIANKTANNTRFVQPRTTSRASIPASHNVRHRGPNPATLGGSTSLRAANVGSLNGAHIARKP